MLFIGEVGVMNKNIRLVALAASAATLVIGGATLGSAAETSPAVVRGAPGAAAASAAQHSSGVEAVTGCNGTTQKSSTVVLDTSTRTVGESASFAQVPGAAALFSVGNTGPAGTDQVRVLFTAEAGLF